MDYARRYALNPKRELIVEDIVWSAITIEGQAGGHASTLSILVLTTSEVFVRRELFVNSIVLSGRNLVVIQVDKLVVQVSIVVSISRGSGIRRRTISGSLELERWGPHVLALFVPPAALRPDACRHLQKVPNDSDNHRISARTDPHGRPTNLPDFGPMSTFGARALRKSDAFSSKDGGAQFPPVC